MAQRGGPGEDFGGHFDALAEVARSVWPSITQRAALDQSAQ
jgi:hypothetical protein